MPEKTSQKPEGKTQPAPSTSSSMSLKKVIAILAVLAFVIVVAVFLLGFLASSKGSASASSLPEAADFTPSLTSSAVYAALAENGVKDALVEFGKDSVIVSLQVPPGADARKTAFMALGAAGALAPSSSTVTVEAFGGSSRKSYSVKASDVQAFVAGGISESAFERLVTES